jgi:hypothetical protein
MNGSRGETFRAGDWVEVRSAAEILTTLDKRGRLDALPFMPEMLEFCGKRFQVVGSAHKTCDTATFAGGRRMRDAVFLDDLRCSGVAHGGCQARCLFFWKTDWLLPADPPETGGRQVSQAAPHATKCSLEQLRDATQEITSTGEVRYFCQATEHLAATEPLRPLAPWHFIEDLRSRNATPLHVLKVVGLHLVWRLRNLGFAWRLSVWLYAWIHRLLMRRPDPFRQGMIPEGQPTPEEKLDLQPGELVQVKSHDDILQTVNARLRNRGLAYNSEMTPACGRTFRVAQRITHIIEEKSGRMVAMKNPCITLEGLYCQALYTHYSLLCSRRVTPYFHEVWLRRAGPCTGSDHREEDAQH